MEITVDNIFGPVLYLFHWRSDKGEMFALFADREHAEAYVTANPEGGNVLLSEVVSLQVIDRMVSP